MKAEDPLVTSKIEVKPASLLAMPTAMLAMLLVPPETPVAEIACPRSITEMPDVSTKHDSWIIVARSGERPLEHAGIYLGTPSEYGAQVPDATRVTKKTESVTWKIRRSETDRFWVGCSYLGTTAMLFRELDVGITTCVASYDLLPSGRRQRLAGMNCR